jgi:hypothetical protein
MLKRRALSAPLAVLVVFVTAAVVKGGLFTGPHSRAEMTERSAKGVCPPFFLRDQKGRVIDPVHGVNASQPYSPKQTCGACHNYDKITRGYHFQQGKGEKVPPELSERYPWMTSPGNYGGRWCSPAPNYWQLARKRNKRARNIDMTSFEFVTMTCGDCHPGGGPLEYDRAGQRYDEFASKPANRITPGGDNAFDGDYFQARWAETGVLEADCLMCHLPGYDKKARDAQVKALNFRWAATAGAGFAAVSGEVARGDKPRVTYDTKQFDDKGFVRVVIAREPGNDVCLKCHQKTDWKKMGATFSSRTDVHLRASLRCVDCHPAGSHAKDRRINGYDEHQIARGHNPNGMVRRDLKDTMAGCRGCHLRGEYPAPQARHAWLPQFHLDRLDCLVCHVPERAVKAASIQDSTVWNEMPRIPEPRRVWSFYGPDFRPWNYYGELLLASAEHQPTDRYRPGLIRYRGKVYPATRLYSVWVGIERKGGAGLDQVFMSDLQEMWTRHRADQSAFPGLAGIRDDNRDGFLEVNRPEEIAALISSVTALLREKGDDLSRKRVVFVKGDRVYHSARDSYRLPHPEWESSPYAATTKLSHDVAPGGAALGANGCSDCHSRAARFFERPVLVDPWDEKARTITQPAYAILGIPGPLVWLGHVREGTLKPAAFWALALVLALAAARLSVVGATHFFDLHPVVRRFGYLALAIVLSLAWLLLLAKGSLVLFLVGTRAPWEHATWHLVTAVVTFLLGLWALAHRPGRRLRAIIRAAVVLMALCGAAVTFAQLVPLNTVSRLAYTALDLAALVAAVAAGVVVAHPAHASRSLRRAANTGE